ncbi:MAG: FliH/SctL family protein [Labedaea sp.]
MSSSSAEYDVTIVVPRERAGIAVPYQLGSVGTGAVGGVADRTAARAEGYAMGWAQGMREARDVTVAARQRAELELVRMLRERDAEIGRGLRAVAAAAGEVRTTTVQRSEDIADFIMTAAVDLAEAILGATVSADVTSAATTALARALAEFPMGGQAVTVRLNPEDHATLTASGVAELTAGRDVTLVADPRLARGDAVAENPITTVDATLSNALERVRQELTA